MVVRRTLAMVPMHTLNPRMLGCKPDSVEARTDNRQSREVWANDEW